MPPENNVVSNQAPVKLGKFKASMTIVKESWNILNQDKEIMWFPVISGIVSLIAVAILGVLFFFATSGGSVDLTNFSENNVAGNVLIYACLLVYYFIMFLIVNFFQAGLFIVVQGRFNGQSLSFKDGINGAKERLNSIVAWSLISASVGVILQMIADKFKFVGDIVSGIFGAAWNILTYFSLPSLIIGKTGVKDSFKESASIIRKNWGETIIVNFGVGLVFGIIGFLLFALCVGIVVIAPSLIVMITVAILFIIAVTIISIISSTLSSIFKLAIYNYAKTGQIPQGFSSSVVMGAIKSKN